MTKRNWKLWVVLAALLVLVTAVGAWWWQQSAKAQAVQYRTAKIERGNLQATVSASGAVNPVTQVSVGTQVSGQIKELYVDFNSEVKAGQLIAQIDPETFEYRVRSAQADLDSARAAVLTAQANIAASNAALSRAKVDLGESQRDFERQQSLADKQFVAQSVADKARALVNSSTESVKAAQAQLGVTQAQIKSAQANVQQRESALAQARIDLSRTKITSPVNGIVIKRAIEKGQTVAASLQSPELFVIAQNLQDMQVDASIDESDVGRIRTGQKASFTVDAFPGQTFEGEVKQVRKAAQNVANVVTYVAVVAFTNNGGRLLPGMTANVRVVTDQRENVLKVPNAAMRVRIAGVEPVAQPGAPGASAPSSSPPSAAPGVSRSSFFSQAFAQPAGGGGFAAQRERLVNELQLTDDQKTKLDAIQSEFRPQLMALRDMDEAARSAARAKMMTDMRSKISAMLSPEQRSKYQAIVANAAANAPAAPSAPSAPSAPTVPVAPSVNTKNATNSIAAKAISKGASGQIATENTNQNTATTVAKPPVPAAPTPPAASPGSTGSTGVTGGGPLAELRNRMVSELQLSADQQVKLDAIYTAARPKFGALRDLAQEERGKARERIMADLRAQVGDMLTVEQKPKYAVFLAEAAGRTSTRGRIYLMGTDDKPVAYNVRLGISDGTSTELIVLPNSPNADVLKEGATVIIGTSAPGAASSSSGGQRPSGPRMPF